MQNACKHYNGNLGKGDDHDALFCGTMNHGEAKVIVMSVDEKTGGFLS